MCQRLVDAYHFDFNKYIKNGPTFQQKVMDSFANDLGRVICPETAHIMINEFIKFMVINAHLVLHDTKYSSLSSDQTKSENMDLIVINGIEYYSTAIFPPHHIDRIWKLLILHSQIYIEFCLTI